MPGNRRDDRPREIVLAISHLAYFAMRSIASAAPYRDMMVERPALGASQMRLRFPACDWWGVPRSNSCRQTR